MSSDLELVTNLYNFVADFCNRNKGYTVEVSNEWSDGVKWQAVILKAERSSGFISETAFTDVYSEQELLKATTLAKKYVQQLS